MTTRTTTAAPTGHPPLPQLLRKAERGTFAALRLRLEGIRAAAEHLFERFFDLISGFWTSPFSDLQESRREWKKCPQCPAIHQGWHRCPNRIVGFCCACDRKVFLNRTGNCPLGHSEIAWRSLRENVSHHAQKEVNRKMPKTKAVHIRKGRDSKAALYCGGGRALDASSLQSVAPQAKQKATCGRCIRSATAAG